MSLSADIFIGPGAFLALAGPVLAIVSLVDLARRPKWAWAASGHTKGVWIVLNAIGIVFFVFGILFGLVYLLAIRPRVEVAEHGGHPAVGYGATGSGSMAASRATGAMPPAGWYRDPSGSGLARYWDGSSWAPDGPR